MDRDYSDLDSWRQARLGDEPIYCAAPLPLDPDDIICAGSDEELDHAARVSKRLRYEEQGLRYLRGKPLRIHSASLRGPFERSSGWQNPWLPKSPTKLLQSDPAPSQSVIRPVAIRQPTLKDIERLSGEEDGTMPGADNSMICHLPSPQSNRDLDLLDSSLDSEKRLRIQAWANDLPSTLEKDEFWAPSQGFDQQNREHSRKRPAGKEWLRTKTSKRTRPNNSQSITAASTPTPMVIARSSLRSVSAPPSKVQKRKSTVTTKNASRSFELATPSSSIDHKQRDSLQGGDLEESTEYHAPVLGDNIPGGSQADYSNTSMPVIAETSCMDIEAQPQDLEPSNAEYIPEESSKQHPANSIDEPEQSAAGDTSFESCLDDSFHYRARHPKQNTPPVVSGALVTDLPPGPTQNGIPEPSNHEGVVRISPAPPSKEQKHSQGPESECQESESSNESSSVTLDQSKQPEPTSDESGEQPTVTAVTPEEAQMEPTKHVDPMLTSTAKDMAISTVTGRVATSIDLAIAHSYMSTSSTVLGIQMDQELSDEVGECLAVPEPLVDGGSTSVEDSMGIDKCAANEMAKTVAVLPPPQSPSVVAIEAQFAADISNSEGFPACGQLSEDGSAVASDPVGIPLSQLKWGVAEVGNASPLKQATTCVTLETVTKAPVVKVEDVEADIRESAQSISAEPAPPIEKQSPWVPDDLPSIHLGVQNVNSEPIEDHPSPSLPQSTHDNLFSTQVVSCESPRVRPSQQSPWTGEIAGPILMEKQPRISDASEETSPEHSKPRSPWAETNTIIMSPPQPSIQSVSALDSDSKFAKQSSFAPSTPLAPGVRSSTPEPCISIKSFANFNTPSPQRRTSRAILQSSSIGQRRGILVGATPSNPWSSARSSRRVSFAPLPGEDDDVNTSPPTKVTRAASPPPQTMAEVEDADVDDKFQNHFESVKRRVSGGDAPKPQSRRRLLPSASQQKPMSPAIGAMAAAFQEADAFQNKRSGRGAGGNNVPAEDKENITMDHGVQSPWRDEGQGVEGVDDDVADVIGNLNEFLDSWDVDAALEQARGV
ncbi:hypothetical protein F5X99DRAFT_365618 [Biscogniauxia marginata]|nr:hypothetical protein F5X99DRAFT_365618 [Biscogniauxia marginata]